MRNRIGHKELPIPARKEIFAIGKNNDFLKS